MSNPESANNSWKIILNKHSTSLEEFIYKTFSG